MNQLALLRENPPTLPDAQTELLGEIAKRLPASGR
jgi:hypothetical protein